MFFGRPFLSSTVNSPAASLLSAGCASEALLGGRVRGRDEDDLYEEGKLDQRLPGT